MIYATEEVRGIWDGERNVRSRSLAATRFVEFPDNDEDKEARRRAAEAMRKGAAFPGKLPPWGAFVASLCADARKGHLLHARLHSRLMVNMAGGVLKNGGLCLDRISGIPYIPGSAVKGCARRMAINNLREGEDKAGLLLDLAWIFGWADQEWQDTSDFCRACGKDHWPSARLDVAKQLCTALGVVPKPGEKPWKSLPNFAGSIAFLPAYPWDGDPGIELDIVTGHHGTYYENTDRGAVAHDIEKPVPNIFPAVSAAGHPRFGFAVLATPRTRPAHAGGQPGELDRALTWLGDGLETFGIGAKTNVGYGWFLPENRGEENQKQLQAAWDEHRRLRPAPAPRAPLEQPSFQHPLASKWRGKLTTTDNFRVALPELAGVEDDGILGRVFEAVIPAHERNNLVKRNRYWQSFCGRPEGAKIFQRLSLSLH